MVALRDERRRRFSRSAARLWRKQQRRQPKAAGRVARQGNRNFLVKMQISEILVAAREQKRMYAQPNITVFHDVLTLT